MVDPDPTVSFDAAALAVTLASGTAKLVSGKGTTVWVPNAITRCPAVDVKVPVMRGSQAPSLLMRYVKVPLAGEV